MSTLGRLFTNAATIAGSGFRGYGQDREQRIKDALAKAASDREERQLRVSELVAPSTVRHLDAESYALTAPKASDMEVIPTDRGIVRVPKAGAAGVVQVPGVEGPLNKPPTERAPVLVQDPKNPEGPGIYTTPEQAIGKPAAGRATKIESATNQAASARLAAAISEMNNADNNMAQFEQSLANGTRKINAGAQVLGRVANAFTHDDPLSQLTQSGALAALNTTDPELARYIRRGLSFAEGESMISQRPSDFRTKMAAFLSTASSGASPEMIADIAGRRRAILDPLNKTAKGGGGSASHTGTTGTKTLTPEQYAKVRQHYSDDEIRAQGYIIP